VLAIVLIYALYLAVVLPLVAIGTCAVCAAGIPVTYLVVLTRVLVSRPAWLPDPKNWPQPPPESDPAVLHYFYGFSCYGLYGPAAADVVHTVRIASDHCRTIWGYSVNAALMSLARRQPQIASLLRATGTIGMGVGIIIGAFVAGCCAFIYMLVVALCAAWWRFLAAVLNGAASAGSRIQTCPSCSAQVDRPQYTCTGRGCQREHHDLRPGQFGVLRRRCHCGTSIRTLLPSGSPPAAAACPHCGRSLAQGPWDTSEILLPFLGATDAARNRQMLSMIEQLRAWDIEGQLYVVPDDSGALGEAGSSPGGFPSSRHSHTVRLLADDGARVLRMFDAMDDLWPGPGHSGKVRTCVLVIAPASADSSRAGMPSALHAGLGCERPDISSTDIGYDKALEQIKAMGLESRDVRLAVVFAQADRVDSPDRKVVRWARRELGLGDLVNSVRRDFKESRFFCADVGKYSHSASLLRWLLVADGVALARNRVVVDVREEEEISYRWHRRYVFATVLAVMIMVLALPFTSWLRNAARSRTAAGCPRLADRGCYMPPTGRRMWLSVDSMATRGSRCDHFIPRSFRNCTKPLPIEPRR